LIASSLGIGLSPLEAVFVTAILNLGVAIPSSPGFVGTYQWLCVAALGAVAVGRADAFAFSVLLHAAWFVPTSVAGLLLLVTKSSARLVVQIRTRGRRAASPSSLRARRARAPPVAEKALTAL
jgi:uncharacterized membrane protein YbhN (UPF0104 family)